MWPLHTLHLKPQGSGGMQTKVQLRKVTAGRRARKENGTRTPQGNRVLGFPRWRGQGQAATMVGSGENPLPDSQTVLSPWSHMAGGGSGALWGPCNNKGVIPFLRALTSIISSPPTGRPPPDNIMLGVRMCHLGAACAIWDTDVQSIDSRRQRRGTVT